MRTRGWTRCFAACAAGGLLFTLSGCDSETADDRLSVTVTVAPLAGLVDRMAGNIADVTVMIPPGASPVTYEPSLSRVRAASSADLYVSVGHPAFAWELTWLAGLLGQGDAVIISGAEACEVLPDDPHIWLSLPCARSIAVRVAEALQEARPAASESVAASLADLMAEMNRMRERRRQLAGPPNGRGLHRIAPRLGVPRTRVRSAADGDPRARKR